jgi:hypothetical protein
MLIFALARDQAGALRHIAFGDRARLGVVERARLRARARNERTL